MTTQTPMKIPIALTGVAAANTMMDVYQKWGVWGTDDHATWFQLHLGYALWWAVSFAWWSVIGGEVGKWQCERKARKALKAEFEKAANRMDHLWTKRPSETDTGFSAQ